MMKDYYCFNVFEVCWFALKFFFMLGWVVFFYVGYFEYGYYPFEMFFIDLRHSFPIFKDLIANIALLSIIFSVVFVFAGVQVASQDGIRSIMEFGNKALYSWKDITKIKAVKFFGLSLVVFFSSHRKTPLIVSDDIVGSKYMDINLKLNLPEK